MTPIALVLTCALAAASNGAAEDDALPPRRDLFGKAGEKRKEEKRKETKRPRRVWGTIELSDGAPGRSGPSNARTPRREEGWLSLTRGVPITFFDTDAKEWRELDLGEIARIDATPRAEELDREWRWKEYGCDEKVYTGRVRPRRWLDHEVTLADGTRFGGRVKGAMIYIETKPKKIEEAADPGEAEPARSVPLRIVQRQRGEYGDTLESLVYVTRITIHEEGKGPFDKPRDGRASEEEGPGPPKEPAPPQADTAQESPKSARQEEE